MKSTVIKETPTWFRAHPLDDIITTVKRGDSCLITSLPGVGKTFLLRRLEQKLAGSPSLHPIYVDFNTLRDLSIESVSTCLLEKTNQTFNNTSYRSLEDFASASSKKKKRYVFILDRFEKALANLPDYFFDTLRALVVSSNRNIIIVTSINQSIHNLRDVHQIEQFYTLVAPFAFYLTPFTKKEGEYYIHFKSQERNLQLNENEVAQIYTLTGGHNRMIDAYIYAITTTEGKILERINKASQYETVRFQCQSILLALNSSQQKSLERLAVNLTLTPQDLQNLAELSKLGIVNESNEITSLRLKEFVTKRHPSLYLDDVTGEVFKKGVRVDDYFTPNEYKFFRYMYENQGRVIDREEIAEAVWEVKKQQGVSDEAIDQLVSRLRDKIETDKYNPVHLMTIRGRGFQLKLT